MMIQVELDLKQALLTPFILINKGNQMTKASRLPSSCYLSVPSEQEQKHCGNCRFYLFKEIDNFRFSPSRNKNIVVTVGFIYSRKSIIFGSLRA